MSSSALLSMLSDDVLRKTEMKPWWEKVRGFIFNVALVATLFLVYDVKTSEFLHCLPLNESITLSNSEAAHLNAKGTSNLLWWVINLPYIDLNLCIITYFFYWAWLIIPSVRSTFETLRECDKTLTGLRLTTKEVKDAVTTICSTDGPLGDNLAVTDEIASTLTSVCCDLWSLKSKLPLSVKSCYILRTFLGSLPIALSLWLLLTTIDEITSPSLTSNVTEMKCYYDVQRQIIAPLSSLLIFRALELLINCSILIRICCPENKRCTDGWNFIGLLVIILAVVMQLGLEEYSRDSTDAALRRNFVSALALILRGIVQATYLFAWLSAIIYALRCWKGSAQSMSKSTSKELDNEFARLFADYSKPLNPRTEMILIPKEVIALKGKDVDVLITELERKTFAHSSEKYFASIVDLIKQEPSRKNFKKYREFHEKVFDDEWARKKLREQPEYCGCKAYLSEANIFSELDEREKSLWESIFDENCDELDLNVVFHVLEHGWKVASEKTPDENPWELIVEFYLVNKLRRKELQRRLRKLSVEWMSDRYFFQSIQKKCDNDLKGDNFRSFIATHFLMVVIYGNDSNCKTGCDSESQYHWDNSCNCIKDLPKHNLLEQDDPGNSLLYYLASSLDKDWLCFMKHILDQLKQPVALKIEESVIIQKTQRKIFIRYIKSRFSKDVTFLTEVEKIFNSVTSVVNKDEIMKACERSLSRKINFPKFALYHAEIFTTDCDGDLSECFCRQAMNVLSDGKRIELLTHVYNSGLFGKKDIEKKKKLSRHLLDMFEWETIEDSVRERLNYRNHNGDITCYLDIKSNLLKSEMPETENQDDREGEFKSLLVSKRPETLSPYACQTDQETNLPGDSRSKKGQDLSFSTTDRISDRYSGAKAFDSLGRDAYSHFALMGQQKDVLPPPNFQYVHGQFARGKHQFQNQQNVSKR